MTIQRTFDYTEPTITAQVVDDSDQTLWIAFSQNGEGNCVLKKVSAFDPSQTFYSIDIAVTEITSMTISGSTLYLAYDDATLMGASYSISNPLTTSTDFDRIVGINESPIDIVTNGTDLFYLIPGNISGENAKIIILSTAGIFDQTIDLLKSGNIVLNANTMAIDTNDDLWIGTYTAPATLVRVYDTGGGVYDFTITQLG